jgi:ATP-dependent helicase HrpA
MLADGLLRISVWYCFFDGRELPRTSAAFDQRLVDGRSRWPEHFELLLRHAKASLERRFSVVRALADATSPAFVAAVKDMSAQVERLVPADFFDQIPLRHLGQIPRYLDAVLQRLAGLQGRIAKDAEHTSNIATLESRVDRIGAKLGLRPDIEDLRFLIEEYRVATFAQRLGTRDKVSVKRLEQTLAPLEEEAGVR